MDIKDRAAELIVRHLDQSNRVEDEINLTADSGTNDLKFTRVEQARTLNLDHLSGYNDTSSPTRIRVGYWNGHRLNWLKTQPAPLISETVSFDGVVRLGRGMYPIIRFEGCTSGDDLHAALNGYSIAAK